MAITLLIRRTILNRGSSQHQLPMKLVLGSPSLRGTWNTIRLESALFRLGLVLLVAVLRPQIRQQDHLRLVGRIHRTWMSCRLDRERQKKLRSWLLRALKSLVRLRGTPLLTL